MPRCDACQIVTESPDGLVRLGGRGWTIRQWCPPCANRSLTGLWGLGLALSGAIWLAVAIIWRESGETWWLRGLLVLGSVLPAMVAAASIHAAGHLLGAWLTGCEVQRVELGRWGDVWHRWRSGSLVCELKTIPLCGRWDIFPKGDLGLAQRMSVVWLAGGAANLATAIVCAVLAYGAGHRAMQGVWLSLALINFLAVAGLIPLRWKLVGQPSWESDGHRLVEAWRWTAEDWNRQREKRLWLQADAALERRDLREAERRFREGMQQVPGDPRGTRGLALVALRAGRWMEARALLHEAAGHAVAEAGPGPGSGWLLPFVDLLLARPEFKSEAERLSAAEYARQPWWPEVQAVRGGALVWSGRTEEGLRLLSWAEEGTTGPRRAVPLLLQAMARWSVGDLPEARRALARAQRSDPANELLPRVAYQLGEPTPQVEAKEGTIT
jgi:hypothetical protein